MNRFIPPPLDEDNSDDGLKTPLRPSKTDYRDPAALLTPSTTATSTSSLSALSPQTSVNSINSGTKRAIDFEDVPAINPKRSVRSDIDVTGMDLSQDKNLKTDPFEESPEAKLSVDMQLSDEDSIDNDPLIPHPTEFQWMNPSIIKDSYEKINKHKSVVTKAHSTMDETIDGVLGYLPAVDLKIHLATLRPGSNINITKPQLKNSIKRVIMKKFYRDYSLNQDIDQVIAGVSNQANNTTDNSKLKDHKIEEVAHPGSEDKKVAASQENAHTLSIAIHDGKGHIGNASFAPGFNHIDPSSVEYKGKKSDTQSENVKTGEEKVWKPSVAGFKKAMESQGPRIGTFYHVSHAFVNPLSMLLWYCVVMEFPPEVWFLKAGYLEALFIGYAQDLGIDPPIWMTSFKDISIRSSPYGANEYKRGRARNGKKGRTIGRIVFYFHVQSNEQSLFLVKLRGALNKIDRLFHPTADPGVFCLQYLKSNASGIVDHFRSTLQTDAEIQNYLTECLVKVFHKRSYSLSFKNSLDRFMMDHDIKEFLETAGVSGWEGVGELTNVFKIYPQKTLPDWDTITMKSYSD